MRLIALHISGFGKLVNRDIYFEEGLNVTLQQNGWGKSTLATFIRVMFYGFENESAKTISLRERARLKPWAAETYGGYIDFEVNGVKYRATKTFGAKADADTFELRDLSRNVIVDDYSDHLGEDLFHIDMNSFMKTVFIRQSDTASYGATDDINAKIGNISDAIDLNRFAAADEELSEAIAKCGSRKNSELSKVKADAAEIKRRLLAGSTIDGTIANLRSRIKESRTVLDAFKDEQRRINERRAYATKSGRRLSLKDNYNKLILEFSDKKAAFSEAALFFKGDIPSAETVDEWERKAQSLTGFEAGRQANSLTESERTQYESLYMHFVDGTPDLDALDAMIKEASALSDGLMDVRRNMLSDKETERLGRYLTEYDNPDRARIAINGYVNDWNERSRLIVEETALARDLSDRESLLYEVKAQKVKSGIPLWAGIILLMLAGFGGYAYYFEKFSFAAVSGFLYGVIAAGALGLVLLITGIAKRSRIMRDYAMYSADVCAKKDRLDKLRERESEIYDLAKNFLKSKGIPFDESLCQNALTELLNETYDFKNLYDRNVMTGAGVDDVTIASVDGIVSFLSTYHFDANWDNFSEKLIELRAATERFINYKTRVDAYIELSNSYKAIRGELIAELDNYRFSTDNETDLADYVDYIEANLSIYHNRLSLVEDVKARIDAFEKENNMDEILAPVSEEDSVTPEELNRLQEALDRKTAEVKQHYDTDVNNLAAFEQQYDDLMQDRETLSEMEAYIAERTKLAETLKITRDYITKAKENLTARYMEPLLNGFSKYYGLITGDSASDFNIDVNTNITKEEYGIQRTVDSFSDGYKDLVGFCMRLAMADSMYPDVKPMLVLDDPFVNLDDSKMEGAGRLLDAVSKEYQILYLTCREQRL